MHIVLWWTWEYSCGGTCRFICKLAFKISKESFQTPDWTPVSSSHSPDIIKLLLMIGKFQPITWIDKSTPWREEFVSALLRKRRKLSKLVSVWIIHLILISACKMSAYFEKCWQQAEHPLRAVKSFCMCKYFVGIGKIFGCVCMWERECMGVCCIRGLCVSMYCERARLQIHVCCCVCVCVCVFSYCPRGRVLNNRPFLTGWDAESCQPPRQDWDEEQEREGGRGSDSERERAREREKERETGDWGAPCV